MRAHEVSFLDLVQGEKQFQIPLYQRTYSWIRQPQLTQLWHDILEHSSPAMAENRRTRHFIGSAVIAPSPSLHAGGVQRWLVIDGQQRLTTLMLVLAALRDHVEPTNPVEADRIHRQYLVNEFRSADEHLRLLPTQADRRVYRSLILKTTDGEQSGNVADAYRFFRSMFVAADDPDDDQDLVRIEQTIRSGLSIVEITAEHGDNVHRIFESLNNTGMKLSQADLLRNYLFMRLPRRGEDVYRDVWLPMQEILTSAQLELLVWLDLVIRGDERVQQGDIYGAQQRRLEVIPDDNEEAVEREIVELARRARHLQRILNPSIEADSAISLALSRLQAWGATTAYPLVMHLLDLRDRGATDAVDVGSALGHIESFLVRRMLCQVPTNNLNRVFNGAPAAVGSATPAAPIVYSYLSGRRRYWPSDAQVRSSAPTRPFYWTGRGPQRSFVLRRLEESYESPEPVDFANAKLTIEHVMPQTMNQEWINLLAPDVTNEGGATELHDLLVHTIGNLTLTAENSKLSNNPFERKQDLYTASSLRMNREIADAPTWGKAQIEARSDALAERMIRIWPGPADGAADGPEGRDWSLLQQACALIPPGAWTTYGDLAELIGSHPVPVGVHLASNPVLNAWRVLTSDGGVSAGFRWPAEDRTDDPYDVLASEGVSFESKRASAAQRMTAADLAALLGMELGDVEPTADSVAGLDSPRAKRFLGQLAETHPSPADGVLELLARWQILGGEFSFGRASETSCALLLESGPAHDESVTPFVIYPRIGSVEVGFQHMVRRPVFDDIAVREQFRQRLEDAGLDVPRSKLSLRPSFPVMALADRNTRAGVAAALEWFCVVFRAGLAQSATVGPVAAPYPDGWPAAREPA